MFEGELSPEEVELVIGVGLNWLMKEGAVPVIMAKPNLQLPPDTVQ